MSAFANLPISRKLATAFAVVVAVIFVSGAIIYGSLGVIEDATNWRVHTAGVLDTLYTMTNAMMDQEAGVHGYLATGDESVLKRYRTGDDAFTLALRKAKGLTSDNPAEEGRIDDEMRELRISSERDASGSVLVTVRDSGPGLDPKSVDRIFDAFHTTKPGGMGLGLAICRSITEAHGGRLWVSANKPRGAAFQFTLPPAQDETVPAGDAG